MRQSQINRGAGSAIREALAGGTIESLAEATGIPRSTLHRKLSGKAPFTVGELTAIATVLNSSPGQLILRAEQIAETAS